VGSDLDRTRLLVILHIRLLHDLRSRLVQPTGEARVYTQSIFRIYEGGEMTKRLIDLDDDLLAAAQKELKTSGVSDTVRIALQQAAAASARARQIAWLKSGGMREMTDPGKRGDAWR
jgi:Arc/MetJ family transcription regulator